MLDAHLELIATDVERWLELFCDDAVVEFPYGPSVGLPERLEGRAAIREYFAGTPATFLGLSFTNLRRHLTEDPGLVLAEVHGSATIASTGRRYEQDYVVVLQTEDGRISRYREYWNPIPALRAFGGEATLVAAMGGS